MLRLNNVEVIYSDVILVLKGLSLAVEHGQIVALLGANGAGKTTTLRAISGLLKAEELGQIVVERVDEDKQPAAAPRRNEGEQRRSIAEGQ